MESGSYGSGGRLMFDRFIDPDHWRHAVDEAIRVALVNLDAVPAPAGEMEVVLGPGWPGVMLHEAVRPGPQGDFHRKQTSTFRGMIRHSVAPPGHTLLAHRRLPSRPGPRPAH